MIRPAVLVGWAAVCLPAGFGCLFGLAGAGVGLLVEVVAAAGWAAVLVRS